ncbi:YgiT-type zinc finger domain-containing protein [candidate division WOR-3 bacterium JGI_Cruoil_03_51_56]|uniref:YgiT-type zinc finger domain-containing protein n=1 Tax=candidate division WOR-3 bacterium JGI_Cruoil_03_51_56 TaxID=1973747 RepID=A0A235BRU8_UNCW3|nr:MAG: YgiT-type zinc finger domain-containing protein [candidate division WOR-3 bacterium JGI_Cruoil_03_51_56]
MNKRKNKESLCPLCGGKKKPGKVTYTVESESGLLIIREVPAMVCSQCGEEWIDADTAKSLEKLASEAHKRKVQFEVVTL